MTRKTRDDFPQRVKDVLAKRVSYKCCNPKCRKQTIGPNQDSNTTSIGVASHITAASPGGPRYDENLTPAERKSFKNGIWLCGNCSILIDKDKEKFDKELLLKWKEEAEREAEDKLERSYLANQSNSPVLEVDIVAGSKGRLNKGYSDNNPTRLENGVIIRMIGNRPIIHWLLEWNFDIVIYNNSSHYAVNVKLESTGTVHLVHLNKLSNINNIKPFENQILKAKYEKMIESDYVVAEEIMKPKIPLDFNNLILKLKWLDEYRNEYSTIIKFVDGEMSS